MPNRPAVKNAFEGLRPSIVREPSRTLIAPLDESKLFETSASMLAEEPTPPTQKENVTIISGPALNTGTLLTKKRREVLVPVTFRIPQSLKEKLTAIAKKHELNQTDLINEGIELNLQRYR